MRTATSFLMIAAACAAVSVPAASDARVRALRHSPPAARPLVVPRRSFLDAGVVVAPGSIPNYAVSTMMTPPIYSYDDRYTRNLPNPYFMPGRPQPIFQFETPGQ
jgi:hypothetical protein